MSDEILIFEQEVIDNFYIKLSSKHDTSVNSIGFNNIGLIETMSVGSPFMMLNFFDGLGDLMNLTYFSPDAEYDFYIGTSKESNTKNSFKISMIEFENAIIGSPNNVAFDMTFLSKFWDSLLKDTHSRSWKDKKYSDVVEEIIKEIGIEQYEIEPTTKLYDVIQPDWTNYQLIKWMSENAINENNIGGYTFGFTANGTFFFKTYDKLYSQVPYKTYTLGMPSNENDKSFSTFSLSNNYTGMLNHGGFGLNHTYFDYETKSFITDKKKYSETNTTQLNDWSFISEEHETAEKRFYGGRNTDTPSVAENKITNIANSFYKSNIIIKGDIDLHIGMVILLEIPPSQHTNVNILNEKYSGSWLVQKVDHNLDFQNKEFSSRLTLVRTGMNGTKLKGFTKTNKGKVIS